MKYQDSIELALSGSAITIAFLGDYESKSSDKSIKPKNGLFHGLIVYKNMMENEQRENDLAILNIRLQRS